MTLSGRETRDARFAKTFGVNRHIFSCPVSRVSCLVLALSACSPPSQPISTEFLAMGTTVSIVVPDRSTENAQQSVAQARAEIERIGREWYAWAKDGELVRLNAALADGRAATVSKELAALLTQAGDFHRRSAGAFDPGIGGLVRLWGFDTASRDARPLPGDRELLAWRNNHATLADVRIDGESVSSHRRDLTIDLGAIGKGYAIDRAIEILRERGVKNALVNAGGSVRCIGRNAARPWRIAIRHPRNDEPLAWLELNDGEAIATSGDYERFVVVDDRRAHHLLDPRTGEPATHTLAVTVVTRDATMADAASTALFIAGPSAWRQTAAALDVAFALRIDASGQVEVTRALRDRLHATSSETHQTDWTVVTL